MGEVEFLDVKILRNYWRWFWVCYWKLRKTHSGRNAAR